MIYTKTQMVYKDEYEWREIGSPSSAHVFSPGPLNRAEGEVVLSVVNEVLVNANSANTVTGQLLERLLIDHLPDPDWSRKQVLAWLKNKLQTS